MFLLLLVVVAEAVVLQVKTITVVVEAQVVSY
jgi:hypothetical protein